MPILVFLVLIVTLDKAVPESVFFDPGWLISLTNFIFIGLVCLITAYFASRNYLWAGRVHVLLLGCGVLMVGLAGLVAGFVRGLPNGANMTVTIHNTGALGGAIFHFVSSLFLLTGGSLEVSPRQRRIWLGLVYAGILVFIALLTGATMHGMLPPFFIQAEGPTPLRQGILGAADILFVFCFLVFIGTYFRNREDFLYWYSMALGLTSVNLTGVFVQSSVGSPVGWVARGAQYLAGAYFLVALLRAQHTAHVQGTSLDSILTRSLSPAEERFRALAENSPDVIGRFDTTLRCAYINPAGTRLAESSAGAMIGKTIAEAGIPKPYCGSWEENIRAVFDTGRPLDVEESFSSKDGVQYYQWRYVPEYAADGTIAYVLAVGRDLTTYKRAEEAVRESEAKYRNLFENMAEELQFWQLIRDERGEIRNWRLVDANPPALRTWGRRIDDIRGKTADEIFGPGSSSHYMAVVQKINAEGVPCQFEDYFPRIRKHFRFTSIPLGEYFITTGFDITDIREAQKLVEQRQVELEAANQELETFAYSVSHDLRAPLRSIDGYSNILLEEYGSKLDAEGQRLLNVVRNSAVKMGRLIDDILAFSRAGRTAMNLSEVDMAEMVRAVIADPLAPAIAGRNIAIDIAELPPARGDRAMLERVWVNLIDNAIKYSAAEPEARIEIGAKVAADENIYFVRDNGVGFDMQYVDKLFGVFQRLHGAEIPGTGIGLAIVKRLVSRHGGRVWAEGKTGEGAAFYFTMPTVGTVSTGQ